MTQSNSNNTTVTEDGHDSEDCLSAKRLDDIGKLLEERGFTDIRFSFGGMAKKSRPDIYEAVADALEAILASDTLAQQEHPPGNGYGLKP